MRMAIVALTLILGAGATLAQTASPPAASAPAAPKAAAPAVPKGAAPATAKSTVPAADPAKDKQEAKKTAKDNIAECMRLWDAATHMSRQEWARTCERIQTRLENLRIENLDLMGTGVRKKTGAKRQGSLNTHGVWDGA